MVCKQILHYKCYIYSIETAHLDSEICVAYINYKVVFVTIGAVSKLRWTSWAPVPNKPTVSVDVKQHFNHVTIVLKKTTTKNKNKN